MARGPGPDRRTDRGSRLQTRILMTFRCAPRARAIARLRPANQERPTARERRFLSRRAALASAPSKRRAGSAPSAGRSLGRLGRSRLVAGRRVAALAGLGVYTA